MFCLPFSPTYDITIEHSRHSLWLVFGGIGAGGAIGSQKHVITEMKTGTYLLSLYLRLLQKFAMIFSRIYYLSYAPMIYISS
jgi:hypothetical protein